LFVGGKTLRAMHIASETWDEMQFKPQGITRLKRGDGPIWVGTDAQGLWRCDPVSGDEIEFGIAQGLPDLHVASLAVHGREVYVGVGTNASGGLVRIDREDHVHVFNEETAPRAA